MRIIITEENYSGQIIFTSFFFEGEGSVDEGGCSTDLLLPSAGEKK